MTMVTRPPSSASFQSNHPFEHKRGVVKTLAYRAKTVVSEREDRRRVLGKYGIPTYFKPTNKLRQLLVKPKDPVDKENVVGPVYKIKCEECEAMHVGETERSLKARFSEHRRPSSTTSEVAKHIHTDQPEHTVKLDNIEILTTEPRWFERGVKEAIYISALNPSLNWDGGRYNLPPVWDNIIKKRVKAERPRTGGGGGLITIVTHNVP